MMIRVNRKSWKRYGFEFLSIFVAVISAFALNNWNENRKGRDAEDKILAEIYNGLRKDLSDIDMNIPVTRPGTGPRSTFEICLGAMK